MGRRVVSSDREGAVTPSRGSTYDQSHPPPVRRVVSSDGRVGPPARRMPQQGPHGGGHRGVRTSDGLDSSYSESELNGETDQVIALKKSIFLSSQSSFPLVFRSYFILTY